MVRSFSADLLIRPAKCFVRFIKKAKRRVAPLGGTVKKRYDTRSNRPFQRQKILAVISSFLQLLHSSEKLPSSCLVCLAIEGRFAWND